MTTPTKSVPPPSAKAVAAAAKAVDAHLYVSAHQHASRHRAELESSERCGCFFCFRTFVPTAIRAWIDGNQTALCPHCGVDSVLGASAVRIDDPFLRKMHQHHFAYRSK
jgi:hypothetical protein